LHLELHKRRQDIDVAVHNHSRWGTIWADRHRIPPVYDQTSAAVDDSLVLFDEYAGDVANQANAAAAVAALGDAKMALLANHGVFVVGKDVRQAYHRCATLEWRCRTAWYVEAAGGGVPMPREVAERHGKLVDKYGMPNQFEAMARRELRLDPTMLED
jgi:L-fuculose-phosphate aldolase